MNQYHEDGLVNHKQHTRLQRFRGVVYRYAFFAFLLTVVFCGLLYVAGLGGDGVQQRINANARASVRQFKVEGFYPHLFYSEDYSSQMDNFTDSLMIQESITMDTVSEPLSIFLNLYLIEEYQDENYDDLILSLEELSETNEPNALYAHYWQGFRIFLRPLLAVMNYQNIRGVIAIAFLALFMAAAFVVKRHAGLPLTIVFFISVAAMNLPIAMSGLQFVFCFYIMFISICCLPFVMRKGWVVPYFFLIGACTQYFDFYTVPVITLGFPVVFMLKLMEKDTLKERALSLGKCVLAWFFAYGFFWLIRLLLVSIFSGYNSFELAFSRFATWTGLDQNELYSSYTPAKSILLSLQMVLLPRNNIWFAIMLAAFVCCFMVSVIKKRISMPSPLYLIVAMLPLLWICIASRATGNHFWFQYRLLAVTIFAVGTFLVDTLGKALEK